MRVAIVAGEASGDQLAAGLMAELRARVPDIHFEAVAGKHMREVGCEVLADADELAVMGIAEVLPEVARLWKLRRRLIRRWKENPPDAFIGVDAPDFNLGLEKVLKQHGIPTVHYVSPTVWAWRPGRVHRIAEAANTVLCLFPFEPDCYREVAVTATFVGHPFAAAMHDLPLKADARKALGLSGNDDVIAIVPGSRAGEVGQVAPVMLDVAQQLAQEKPQLQFVLPAASDARRTQLEALLVERGMTNIQVIDGNMRLALRAADAALVTSGTATLESLLAGTPMSVIYRASVFTNFLLRGLGLLRTKYVSLPNVLAGYALVPEFLQELAERDAVLRSTRLLLDNEGARAQQIDAFVRIFNRLHAPTNERAAEAVLALVKGK